MLPDALCSVSAEHSHVLPLLRGSKGTHQCYWRNAAQTGRCFPNWKIAAKINLACSADNSKQKLWEVFSVFVVSNGARVNNLTGKTACICVWDRGYQQHTTHTPTQNSCQPQAMAVAVWGVGFYRKFLCLHAPLTSPSRWSWHESRYISLWQPHETCSSHCAMDILQLRTWTRGGTPN